MALGSWTVLARLTLALGSAAAAFLMLGPFQGAEERLMLTDKQAHAIAFFALTALSFLAAPRMRKTDLALAAVAIGAAMEIAQLCVGRSGSVLDLSADAVGVFMAWAPAHFESIRRRSRAASVDRRSGGAAAEPERSARSARAPALEGRSAR
jgi:VanZ family protein